MRKAKNNNKRHIKCDDCGSGKIIQNNRGYIVCGECGLTLNEEPIIDNRPTFYGERKGIKGSGKRQQGKLLDGTKVGTKRERAQFKRYKRLQRCQRSSFADTRKERRLHLILNKLKSAFNVGLQINHFILPIKKMLPKLPKGTQAKNDRYLATIVFYYICRYNGIFIDFEELLENMQIPNKKINRVITIIYKYQCEKYIKINHNRNLENLGQVETALERLLCRFVEEHVSKNHSSISQEFIMLSNRFYKKLKIRFSAMKPKVRMAFSVVLVKDAMIQKQKIGKKEIPPTYKISRFFNISQCMLYTYTEKYGLYVDENSEDKHAYILIKRSVEDESSDKNEKENENNNDNESNERNSLDEQGSDESQLNEHKVKKSKTPNKQNVQKIDKDIPEVFVFRIHWDQNHQINLEISYLEEKIAQSLWKIHQENDNPNHDPFLLNDPSQNLLYNMIHINSNNFKKRILGKNPMNITGSGFDPGKSILPKGPPIDTIMKKRERPPRDIHGVASPRKRSVNGLLYYAGFG